MKFCKDRRGKPGFYLEATWWLSIPISEQVVPPPPLGTVDRWTEGMKHYWPKAPQVLPRTAATLKVNIKALTVWVTTSLLIIQL